MNEAVEKILVKRLERWHERLKESFLAETVEMEAVLHVSERPIPWAEARSTPGRPVRSGESWGRAWDVVWLHLTGRVPEAWAGRQVVAQLDLGGEGLVLDADGAIIQGVSTFSVYVPEFKREIVPLYGACRGGEQVDLWVEASSCGLFGLFLDLDPAGGAPDRHGRYDAAIRWKRLAVFDETIWHLSLDLRILLGLIRRLPAKSVRRARLLHVANEAADRFAGDLRRAAEARAILSPELGRPAASSDPIVTAVGHAHIDTAWLWPVDESIRKCARTFASQLRLIERYPGYVFGASQAQHYAFTRENYPELYNEIRRRIAEGRWEVQGGMWVEADCNLISGESMVRQILHGKNFFRDEFGVDVANLWLPDVFGYSAALPQILRRSGIDSLVTQKMSWNQINDFPHTTFRWRGIDGSDVIAHFPPENNYNSLLDADALVPGMENFRERGFLPEFLSLFGVGDGGGGPKEEQIECGLRLADCEGAPRVRFGTASGFIERLKEREESLPVWDGELYLELHRGTLTTQAEVKRGNRRGEEILRAVEILFTALPAAAYPGADLDRLWKLLLLNQFHDILPGSSIARQYERTRREHQQILDEGRSLIRRAAESLFVPDPDAMVVFQPHADPYSGAIALPNGWESAQDEKGHPLPCQREGSGAVARVRVNGLGFLLLRRSTGAAPLAVVREALILENELVRYEFAPDGTIRRAFDKVLEREILEPGANGNLLTLYEDRPNDWDAWDVDLFYEKAVVETARPVSVARFEGGPIRQRLEFDLAIGGSSVRQSIILAAGSRRLDFETEVEWRERHRMLRVSFPTAVRAAEASYEIQFGLIRRPTHRNTSWDLARFEAVAHRYVDLSDRDYGVALLNDGKYGHKAVGNLLDLNLLRSPTYPDADADRGTHRFTYALYPHPRDLVESDVVEQAASLNKPPMRFPGYTARSVVYPIHLSGEGIALSAVKRAERDPDRILRIVETRGRRTTGRIEFTPARGTLVETDLLEWSEIGDPCPCDGGVEISLAPFEVRTYRWRIDR